MNRNIFLIVLIIILVLAYATNMYETYTSGSFDITSSITTNMDWKGAILSKLPYFTNNLVNPPPNVLSKIQELQNYQPNEDGPTSTTWVSDGMTTQNNIDNPNAKEGFQGVNDIEGFTPMNPYVPN